MSELGTVEAVDVLTEMIRNRLVLDDAVVGAQLIDGEAGVIGVEMVDGPLLVVKVAPA